MKLVVKGFEAKYNLKDISVVTPQKSFKMEGIPYSASIQLRTTNVVQTEDTDLGSINKEEILITKMLCEDSELRELNTFFNKVKTENKSIEVISTLAKGGQKGVYTATAFKTAMEIMQDIDKQPNTTKQHSSTIK